MWEQFSGGISLFDRDLCVRYRWHSLLFLYFKVKRISPNDPDATRKLRECEKAVKKLKFEEAISVPVSERISVAESIDFHTIGILRPLAYLSIVLFVLSSLGSVFPCYAMSWFQ